jgi:YVTN family beta-propeller protein
MIKQYLASAFSLLVISAVFTACKESPTQPPIVIPGEGEPIVYSKHIEPIFRNSCGGSGCHLDGENAEGLALNTWDDVMKGSESGAVVIPFAAVKSHLLQHISTDTTVAPIARPTMPMGRDPLPREQILLIKRWIAEGAKNDAGQIALSGDRPRVFVTNQSEDKVVVIDQATQRIARYFDVGSNPGSPIKEFPHNILLSPDKHYLYVNTIKGGTVEKYDAQTFTKIGSVQVGSSPAQIAVTADGSTLYVSNFDVTLSQRFINKVDAATMTSTPIPDVGAAPHGVTLGKGEHFLYTANALGDNISEVDLATFDVVRRIPMSIGVPPVVIGAPTYEPYQSVLSTDGTQLWVTCRTRGDVRVVDIAAGRVIDSIPVGTRPQIPAIRPGSSELWVPNQGSDNISIIDMSTRAVLATIQGVFGQPHAIAFNADGTMAYVSCENQKGTGSLHHPLEGAPVIPGIVYVIDVQFRTIIRQIEVGGFAAGIAIM